MARWRFWGLRGQELGAQRLQLSLRAGKMQKALGLPVPNPQPHLGLFSRILRLSLYIKTREKKRRLFGIEVGLFGALGTCVAKRLRPLWFQGEAQETLKGEVGQQETRLPHPGFRDPKP